MMNLSKKPSGYCQCLVPLSFRQARFEVGEEIKEFLHEPSWDELSDCMYGVGRMVAGWFGRVYVSMPGDARHKEKIDKRMADYGCVRSKRHLVQGRCPSENNL